MGRVTEVILADNQDTALSTNTVKIIETWVKFDHPNVRQYAVAKFAI